MTSLDLLTSHITDLSSEGTVTHVNAIGDDVEVWLSMPTSEGKQYVIRRIACQTPEQAQSVARLWKAVWC
jgi:ACT domain-containing protein